MRTSIVIKRLKAFLIDYLIILAYLGILLATSLLVSRIFQLKLERADPVVGQLISFVTASVPVILYFTLMEKGKYAATIGKIRFGLKIANKSFNKAGFWQLLLRNCIKFLPWELAHFFLFRLFYFDSTGTIAPDWVFAGLIGSQLLAILYLLFIIFSKSKRSIYELFSQTRVVQNNKG